jgi:hypothetical protein
MYLSRIKTPGGLFIRTPGRFTEGIGCALQQQKPPHIAPDAGDILLLKVEAEFISCHS